MLNTIGACIFLVLNTQSSLCSVIVAFGADPIIFTFKVLLNTIGALIWHGVAHYSVIEKTLRCGLFISKTSEIDNFFLFPP